MNWRSIRTPIGVAGLILLTMQSRTVGDVTDGPGRGTHETRVWTEQSFDDFKDGVFDDGAVQFYATARGDIRAVNQFDLNVDGAVDLVFCNTHGTVEKPDALLYPGSPDGFSSGQVIPIPTDGGYYSLIKDLDGDGRAELVIMNCENGTNAFPRSFIYWGQQDGYSPDFRSEIQTYFPGRPAADDLNADGFVDLVIPNGPYTLGSDRQDDIGVRIHWGSPRGYDDYNALTLGEQNVKCVAVGRFGQADATEKPTPSLLVGTRDGLLIYSQNPENAEQFERAASVNSGAVSQVVVTDLNGDGLDDALLNPGPGSPVKVIYASPDGLDIDRVSELGINGGRALACVDIDADGSLDLAVAGSSDAESTLYWGAQGNFSPDRSTPIPTTYACDVIATDIDGDGHVDLVIGQEKDKKTTNVDSLVLYGTGGRDPGARLDRLPGHGTKGLGAGDVNGDGQIDLVLTGRIAGDVKAAVPSYIYWNDGEGGFSPQNRTGLTTRDAYEAAAADLNFDGYPDLIFAEQYETQGEIGESSIYWGDAKGFSEDRRTGLVTYGPLGVTVADLNRDGYIDIVFGQLDRVPRQGSDKPLHLSQIFWGGKDGYSTQAATELPTPVTGTPAAADLNRDGWIDLVFPNGKNTDGARLYWGGPDGYHEDRSELLCFERGYKCEVVDLNADGWLDLLFVIRAKGKAKDTYSLVYLGSAQGFSEKRRLELPTRGAGDASVADLNRDGRLDVLLTNYASILTRRLPLYIYWGSDTGWSPMNHTELPANSGSGNLIADFNADGWLDLAIACHRVEGSTDYPGYPNSHNTKSFVYMGSAQGFDPRKKISLPTIGVHGMLGTDAGHVYHRRPQWVYTSSVHELAQPASIAGVRWSAKTYDDAWIELQFRVADTAKDLQDAPWLGPQGEGTWFADPSDIDPAASRQAGEAKYAQYRVRFHSRRNARYPSLDKVELVFQ
jgi:FG-GAP-like repeat